MCVQLFSCANFFKNIFDDIINESGNYKEFSQYQITLFYFFKQEFDTTEDAHNAAMEIIRKIY